MKRVAFKTIGCRLNQAETATIAARFLAAGYTVVPFEAPCDVAVIHSCTITQKAEKTSLRAVRTLKRRSPAPIVALIGCAVEIAGERIKEKSGADLVLDQNRKYDLPVLIARNTPHPDTVTPYFKTTRALVKAQDGCSFHCAYCIVPSARGPARSRPFQDVVDDVTRLTRAGHREIVLTGANLGTFSSGGKTLVDLVAAVEHVPEVARIRLSSIELSTTEKAILDYMAQSEKLCRFLHLPLQSGDDLILQRMRRSYSSREYRHFVEYALGRVPNLGLGTDIIVGFPGETAASFQNTCAMVRDLPFSNLHVFPFSPRPGTPAANLPDDVPPETKRKRAKQLIDMGQDKRNEFARRFFGQSVSVLVESLSPHGDATGWTNEYVRARIHCSDLKPNDIVDFCPTDFREHHLV